MSFYFSNMAGRQYFDMLGFHVGLLTGGVEGNSGGMWKSNTKRLSW